MRHLKGTSSSPPGGRQQTEVCIKLIFQGKCEFKAAVSGNSRVGTISNVNPKANHFSFQGVEQGTIGKKKVVLFLKGGDEVKLRRRYAGEEVPRG